VPIKAIIPTTLTKTPANFIALKPLNNATSLFVLNTSMPFLLQVTGLLAKTACSVKGFGEVPRNALYRGSHIRAKNCILATIGTE
jgi:hypothetical protein